MPFIGRKIVVTSTRQQAGPVLLMELKVIGRDSGNDFRMSVLVHFHFILPLLTKQKQLPNEIRSQWTDERG